MKLIVAFAMAMGMFTALPVPWRPWDDSARGWMLATLPLVGAVLGLIWAGLSLLARAILPAGLAAAAMTALPLLLTGCIHLDGYMDTCDALLSWRPLEERLRILKDPHAGSFAVAGAAMLLLFQYAAAQGIPAERLRALALVPALSRCGSALCVLTLPPLGHSEYRSLQGAAAERCCAATLAILTLILAGLWLGRAAVLALLAEAACYALAMAWAAGTLRGVSGDLAGFALTISECAALVALAAIP